MAYQLFNDIRDLVTSINTTPGEIKVVLSHKSGKAFTLSRKRRVYLTLVYHFLWKGMIEVLRNSNFF